MARKRRYRWLSPSERVVVVARFRAGASVREVVSEFGLPRSTAYLIRDQVALARRRVAHSSRRLSFEERERIFEGDLSG